ncbi:MAG: SPOR domain-containing protein [Gammaproteobacteria bacterium]|jgi:cell division septation protein DedD
MKRHKHKKRAKHLLHGLREGHWLSTEHNNIWVLLAMSVVIAALIVSWWAVSNAFSISGIGNFGEAEEESSLAVAPPVPATGYTEEIGALTDTLRDLNETARMLMDSITYLESKLIRAHVLSDSLIEAGETLTTARLEQGTPPPGTTRPAEVARIGSPPPPATGTPQPGDIARIESLPPPAAVGPSSKAPAPPPRATAHKVKPEAKSATAEKPAEVAARSKPGTIIREARTVAADSGAKQAQAPAGELSKTRKPETTRMKIATAMDTPASQPKDRPPVKRAKAGSGNGGAWVINLASLNTRKEAENFKSKAGMKGFDTSLKQVHVKGREYWRVRVTGLDSLEEARTRGEAIKERLGLKEIWISKR